MDHRSCRLKKNQAPPYLFSARMALADRTMTRPPITRVRMMARRV
jgi:hypothetical protein